jgi:hypothetical protein
MPRPDPSERAMIRTRVRPQVFARIGSVLRASRPRKIVPVLLIPPAAALMAGPQLAARPAAMVTAYVLFVGLFGMTVNALSDRALDLHSKPHLYEQVAGDLKLTRRILYAEAFGCLLLLVVMALSTHPAVAALSSVVGALFVLYSYNFIVPRRAIEWRLKVFWWGNLATVLGGYLGLWLIGFALAGVRLGRPETLPWLGAAATFACLDYAVFLNECGLDSADEHRDLHRTLPALLGQRGVAVAALAVWTLGLLSFCALASAQQDRSGFTVFFRCARPALFAAGAICLFFVLARATQPNTPARRLRERLIDGYFTAMRLGLVGFLVLSRYAAHGTLQTLLVR